MTGKRRRSKKLVNRYTLSLGAGLVISSVFLTRMPEGIRAQQSIVVDGGR